MKMRISQQRITEVKETFVRARRDLQILHAQGENGNLCVGWQDCDCRLADQIRGIARIETEWEYRAGRAR